MTMLRNARPSLPRRLASDRRGNVAMMFGLMVLPMLGAVGLAIDFGTIMTARTKAQMAADAAALQASGVVRELIKDSDGSEASTTAAIAEGKRRGDLLFKAHADKASLKDYTIDTVVKRDGQNITASANFTVRTSTYLATLFSKESFTAAGDAVSSSSLPAYSDVYLALDISGSMGIAASQAEMVKLFNAKGKQKAGKSEPTGCVFGCHTIETDKGWTESFSTVAAKNNVRLRIDVLRDAVIEMITTAEKDSEASLIYRIALHTMGATANAGSWALNQVAPLSNNFSSLRNAAKKIDIATPPGSAPQKQNSYINEQLNSLANTLPSSFSGSSQAKSKKYVFLVTDGARDVPQSFGSCTTPPNSGRCVNSINPAYCEAIKNKGITVGVLYTTYVPVTEDPAIPNGKLEYWFNLELMQTGAYAKIAPALKQCASDGWFFEASDADSIKAAMAKMFEQTTLAPTLTN
jgi:Flp pilus assembly protein TadG